MAPIPWRENHIRGKVQTGQKFSISTLARLGPNLSQKSYTTGVANWTRGLPVRNVTIDVSNVEKPHAQIHRPKLHQGKRHKKGKKIFSFATLARC